MISAHRFSVGTEGPEPVPVEDIALRRDDSATLLWVDVGQPTREEIDTLVRDLELHPLLAEDLIHANQRTKLDRYGDHFHIAVHDCTLDDLTLERREIDIAFGRGWLLTVRQDGDQRPAPAVLEDLRSRFDLVRRVEHEPGDVGLLLWAILDVVVDRYFAVIDELDNRLDDIEEIVFAGNAPDATPHQVFELRRSLGIFRRSTVPLRDVLSELLRHEGQYLSDRSLIFMRDVYDHILRVAELIETQRELLTGLLEAHLGVVSNRTNRVMKVTSSWGAIILGATLIAGIYGMNFRYMPELDWRYGYFIALGLMGVLTVALVWWFRKKDWL
ncbi:MAG: magnesium/cobalt transporter CorA [Acidimicrobiia bacterium]